MMRRGGFLFLTGLLMLPFVVAGLRLPAEAQLPTPLPSLTPINPPQESPAPEPSSTPSRQPSPSPSAKDTESPKPRPSPSDRVPPQSAEPRPGPGPFGIAIPSLPRTPPGTTDDLAQILAPLADRGMPIEKAFILAVPPFPVAGQVRYSDDWQYPRIGPPPHPHEGTDMFSAFGTPVVASGPGTVAGMGTAGLGGISVWVSADDGHGFYYAHLSSFAEGLTLGKRVDAGTVIGYVGNSGNAATTAPHVHIEIHPPVKDALGRLVTGGVTTLPDGTGRTNTPPANPKPYLDRWLEQAESNARKIVAEFLQRVSSISRQLYFAQRIEQLQGDVGGLDRPGQLVWLSVLDPTLASLGLAREAALEVLLGQGGSIAQRRAEEERVAGVRYAVNYRRLKLLEITGQMQAQPGL